MSEPAAKELITFEQFSKVQLKIGKVVHADSMLGMNKVFKAKIDLGGEELELAVGGANFYKPGEFIGQNSCRLHQLGTQKDRTHYFKRNASGS